MQLLFLILQNTQSGGGTKSFFQNPLLLFALLIIVFYFFFIRPQTRKNKEMKKYRESLQKGDKVVTIGGIHGKISEVRETTLVIELIDQTRMEVEKSAISNDSSVAKEQMAQRK